MKFEDLPIKQQLISYLRATYSVRFSEVDALWQEQAAFALFATSDPAHHEAAKELIDEGLLVDRTEEAFAPGSPDRAYSLTEAGKKKFL